MYLTPLAFRGPQEGERWLLFESAISMMTSSGLEHKLHEYLQGFILSPRSIAI